VLAMSVVHAVKAAIPRIPLHLIVSAPGCLNTLTIARNESGSTVFEHENGARRRRRERPGRAARPAQIWPMKPTRPEWREASSPTVAGDHGPHHDRSSAGAPPRAPSQPRSPPRHARYMAPCDVPRLKEEPVVYDHDKSEDRPNSAGPRASRLQPPREPRPIRRMVTTAMISRQKISGRHISSL